jgi:hypothetical protein
MPWKASLQQPWKGVVSVYPIVAATTDLLSHRPQQPPKLPTCRLLIWDRTTEPGAVLKYQSVFMLAMLATLMLGGTCCEILWIPIIY